MTNENEVEKNQQRKLLVLSLLLSELKKIDDCEIECKSPVLLSGNLVETIKLSHDDFKITYITKYVR